MSAGSPQKINKSGVSKKSIDQVFAFLWIAVGLVLVFQSLNLEYMAEYGPGPGFLPFWLAVGFILMGMIIFVQATYIHKQIQPVTLPDKRSVLQMILVLIGYFGFVFLSEHLGFMLCIGILFLFLLSVVEKKGWKFSIAAAFTSMLLFWIIFEIGLKLHLPKGILSSLRWL